MALDMITRTMPSAMQNVRRPNYGVAGDGTTDDTLAISDAITDTALYDGTLYFPRGTYLTGAQTFPSNVEPKFSNGAKLKVNNATVTFNSLPDAGDWQIFELVGTGKVVFTGVNRLEIKSAWWGDRAVTVPAPAAAPTLASDAAFSGTFTNTTTYLVAYTYVAWNGETGISPTTSFTAKNNQCIAVMPKASLANNSKYAVGCHVYISPNAGTNWYRADGMFTRPALVSFGDDTAGWGGAVIHYANGTSGAAPPAPATTTTTKTGITISAPAVAPTVTNLNANAAATYFGAYAYLCEDGTESALSPVSSGHAAAIGTYIRFQRNEEPPSGAVAVRVYLGTSSTPANLHLQATWPLHYVRGEIHDYNSSGAAPSAGAAVSTVSGVQQSYDAMMDSGKAGRIYVVGADIKVPLILRLKNSSGSQVKGIEIVGTAGHGSVFQTGAAGRLSYTGAGSTSVVGVLCTTTDLRWSGVDLRDPNSRLSVGLAGCDFTGGSGFENKFYWSSFEAYKAGGVGYHIATQSATSGSHTTSEQHFYDCCFIGRAWGIDIHGNQTFDIGFFKCEFLSDGDSNSANSGQIRTATKGVTIVGWEGTGAATIGYIAFVTRDVPHPLAGSYGLTMRDVGYDAVAGSATSFIHVSGVAINNGIIALSDCVFNSSLSDHHAFYSGTSASLFARNSSGGGNCWVNWVNTTPSEATDKVNIWQAGADTFFDLGSTYAFKATSATTVSITNNANKVTTNITTGVVNTVPATPAQITANQNNYNPGSQARLQQWFSDASRNVTGLAFSNTVLTGESHAITNVGSFDIVLKHDDAGSTTANRFICSTGADLTLSANQSVDVIYDGTISRWRVLQPLYTASRLPTSAGTEIFGIDEGAGSQLSIANNATATPFSNTSNFAGMIIINDPSVTGGTGVFVTGGGGSVVLVSQAGGTNFSTVAGTASRCNVYGVSNVITIENKLGATANFRVFAIRMRTTGA